MTSDSFFGERAGVLTPQQPAGSGWGTSHMRGLAISGALARAAEDAVHARPELEPVRWKVDLYSPARMEPSTATATIVRESRRLCLVDAVFCQGGKAVSRASGLFVGPSENPAGQVWTHAERIEPPEPATASDSERRTAVAAPGRPMRRNMWLLPRTYLAAARSVAYT